MYKFYYVKLHWELEPLDEEVKGRVGHCHSLHSSTFEGVCFVIW